METDFYDEAAKNGVEVGHYYFRQQLDNENAIHLVFTFCKYEGKYVIRTEKDRTECTEYSIPECFFDRAIYDSFKEAEDGWLNLLPEDHYPSHDAEIADCISKTSYPDDVTIVERRHINVVNYEVYYKGQLIIDQMRYLRSKTIDKEIERFNQTCEQYGLQSLQIFKRYDKDAQYFHYCLVEKNGIERACDRVFDDIMLNDFTELYPIGHFEAAFLEEKGATNEDKRDYIHL